MEESIIKFKKYLQKVADVKTKVLFPNLDFPIKEIKNQEFTIPFIENAKIYLKVITDPDYNIYFDDFLELSKYILLSDLKSTEYLDVILFFIKRNLLMFNKNSQVIVTKGDILTDPFCISHYETCSRLLNYSSIELLNKELTAEETYCCEKLAQIINDLSFYYNFQRLSHILILKHYIEKIDNYNKIDMKIVTRVLEKLQVDTKIVNLIAIKLEKNFLKRQKEKIILPVKETKEHELKISPSEILKNYINLENNEPLRFLDMEERIYCVYLLRKNNINAQEIKKFLDSCELQYIIYEKELDKLEYIKMNLKKIEYYAQKYGLLEELAIFQTSLELLNYCTEEEKDYYISNALEEMNKIRKLVPRGYEYEYKMAKLLGEKKE